MSREPQKQRKLFYFEHPHGWALEGDSGVALQGDSGAGHSGDRQCRETLGLGLWGWALEGDSGVGHSKETRSWVGPLGLGTPLQGDSGVGDFGAGHCGEIGPRGSLGLGTPGTLWSWAL